MTGHNTGNNLLSHRSVAALPSAHVSLTSVFEMGTCVSLLLWSPESGPRKDAVIKTSSLKRVKFQFIVITFNKYTIFNAGVRALNPNYKKKAVTNTFE